MVIIRFKLPVPVWTLASLLLLYVTIFLRCWHTLSFHESALDVHPYLFLQRNSIVPSAPATSTSIQDPTDAETRIIHAVSTTKRDSLYAKYAAINRSQVSIQPRRQRGACGHQPKTETTYSAVEFAACCGLGHRLARMAAAAHVAVQLSAGLYGFWKCCDMTDVFTHPFGDEPLLQRPPANVTSAITPSRNNTNETNYHIQFRNKVPGSHQVVRSGADRPCQCTRDKVETDYKFYASLM
jgi:hypothetical protein